MNYLFVKDFIDNLESVLYTSVEQTNQKSVKELLTNCEYGEVFPMISSEYTPDSNFNVDISESKFLNDNVHNGCWFVCGEEGDVIYCLINLKQIGEVLEIDTFEVNKELRCQGIGGNVVNCIEDIAERYFDAIYVSPFDTDAMNFWCHMGYEEDNMGNWVKKLNNVYR